MPPASMVILDSLRGAPRPQAVGDRPYTRNFRACCKKATRPFAARWRVGDRMAKSEYSAVKTKRLQVVTRKNEIFLHIFKFRKHKQEVNNVCKIVEKSVENSGKVWKNFMKKYGKERENILENVAKRWYSVSCIIICRYRGSLPFFRRVVNAGKWGAKP